MAKPKKSESLPVLAPGVEAEWQRSNATYIAGRAHLDGTDELADQLERKWGVGRLRLLVNAELREKFDRQRYLYNQALYHGTLEDVRRESARMAAGWRALDRAATEAGAAPIDANTVFEIADDNGGVIQVVQEWPHKPVQGDERRRAVYTMQEIKTLLAGFPALVRAKEKVPGAEVIAARYQTPRDPLDGILTSEPELSDEIPF